MEGGALRHASSWLARKATHATGSAWGFGVAALVVLAGALAEPLFGFSDAWQLAVNTGTTIVTFLTVFPIPHSQSRDAQALQLKPNGLPAATEGASNRLVGIEGLSEDGLGFLHGYCRRLADRVREGAAPEKRALDGESPATHERKGHTPTDRAIRGRRTGSPRGPHGERGRGIGMPLRRFFMGAGGSWRVRIDPWASQQSTDYARLRDEFGIQAFDPDVLPEPSPLMQRGVIFGERGFDRVARALSRAEPWGVLTGLMPSGPMHFGHKLVMDQVTYYQRLGADVTITIADIEAYATRGLSLEKSREIALRNYVRNYLALGLDASTAQIYFQSRRQSVKDLAWKLGRKVNWSTFESIYGFGGATNMSHAHAPLVQVGDILHVQLPQHGGPRPIVVPVGVDQDPHVRLTRDLAMANRLFKLADGSEDTALVTVSDSQNDAAVASLYDSFKAHVARVSQTPAFQSSETSREFFKEWRKQLEKTEKALKRPDESRAAMLAAILLALRGLGLESLGFDKRAIGINAPHGVLEVKGYSPREAHDIDLSLAKLESSLGGFGFVPPAATYHRFMQGLQGGKMSSSKPESHISMDDTPESAEKKMGAALTGGRETAEEQRRLGGRAEECMVYETYVYHLVPDQKELSELYRRCKSGEMLCGECKGIAKEKVRVFMKTLQEKRDEKEHLLKEIVRED